MPKRADRNQWYQLIHKILEKRWPGVVREYKFHDTRKWRLDYAWPMCPCCGNKIAMEIEGGIWIDGDHVRGKRYESDCEKYSWAAVLGWRVIRGSPDMWEKGIIMGLLERAHESQ